MVQNTSNKNECPLEVNNIALRSTPGCPGQINDLKSEIRVHRLRVPGLVLKQTGTQLNNMQRLATSRYDFQKSVLDKVVNKTKGVTVYQAGNLREELCIRFPGLQLRLKMAMEKLGKTINQIDAAD